MSAQAIAVFDVEMRFKTLAAGADREKALVILDRLPWSVMWRKPTMYLPKRRSLPWGKSGKTTSSGEIETEHPAYLGSQDRSEEHTSELQSLMRISYAVFCLKKKTRNDNTYT